MFGTSATNMSTISTSLAISPSITSSSTTTFSTSSQEYDSDSSSSSRGGSLTRSNAKPNSEGLQTRRKTISCPPNRNLSPIPDDALKAQTRRISDTAVISPNGNNTNDNKSFGTLSRKKFHPFKKSDDEKEKAQPRRKSPRSDFLTSFISSSEKSGHEDSKDYSPSQKSPKSEYRLSAPSNHAENRNSVKFAFRTSLAGSDPDWNCNAAEQPAEKLLIKDRLKNKETLLHYFDCVRKVYGNPNLALHLDANNCLGCYSKKKEHKQERQKVLATLYAELIEAVSLKNTLFFSSKGASVSLENFDELIMSAYPKRDAIIEIFRSAVLRDIGRRSAKDPKNLRPNNASSENADLSLFPVNTSILQIKKLKSPEEENLNERFKLIEIVEAKNDEMVKLHKKITEYMQLPPDAASDMQKLAVLNFYKSRMKNFQIFVAFLKSWISNPYMDEKVLKCCILNKDLFKIKIDGDFNDNLFVKRLNKEIEYLSNGINFEYGKPQNGKLDVDNFLSKTLPSNHSEEMRIFLDAISSDMKILAAQTFNLVTFDTCMLATSSKYPDEPTLYSNRIAHFIYKNFNAVLTRYAAVHDKKNHTFTDNYFNLYMFFVNLAVELIKKYDYLSSFAIYTALESTAIEWIIKERKDVPHSFQENLSFYKATFNPTDSFIHLRELTTACRINKIFHIPSTNLFKTIIHDYERLPKLTKTLTEQITDLKEEITDLEDKIKAIEDKIKAIEEEIKLLKEGIKARQEEIKTMEAEKKVKQEEMMALEAKMKTFEEEIKPMEIEQKSLMIKHTNDDFEEIRFNFETAYQNYTPHSNISNQISSCNQPVAPEKPDAEVIAHYSKKGHLIHL